MRLTQFCNFNIELIYAEKIGDLEVKLKYDEDEIQRKNRVISELEAQLEAAKISIACQSQIDEISMPLLRPCRFNYVIIQGRYVLFRILFLTTLTFRKFYHRRMWLYSI